MGLGDWWTDGRWTGWEADPLTGHKVGQISSPRGLSTIFLISETRLFFLKGTRCYKSETGPVEVKTEPKPVRHAAEPAAI